MPVRKTYSKADRRQALRLHQKGWGYGRIAEVIGCFPSTVRKWVEAAGLPKHPGPKRSDKDRKRALDWYVKHAVSINAVAKKFNIHPRTLSRWIREEGIEVRSVQSSNRESILQDIQSGMKKREIAAKHGCSESWVYRVQSGS